MRKGAERMATINWFHAATGNEQIATMQRGRRLEAELKKHGLKPGADFASATFYLIPEVNTYPVILNLSKALHPNHYQTVRDALDDFAAEAPQITGEKLLIRVEYPVGDKIPEPPNSQRIAVMNFGLQPYKGPDIS